MKPRRSLDSALLAVITIAFGALCASALLVDVWSVPDAPAVATPA
jgi:hypothetical protein